MYHIFTFLSLAGLTSNIWTGVNDQYSEDTFVCSDRSQVPNNAADFFAKDQPDNWFSNEDCAAFGEDKNFMLNDNACSYVYKILCEISAP